MSEWYEADEKNITVDLNNNQVDILVTSNDNGNIYVILPFELISDLSEKIKGLTC